jgi:hypothetical protein
MLAYLPIDFWRDVVNGQSEGVENERDASRDSCRHLVATIGACCNFVAVRVMF